MRNAVRYLRQNDFDGLDVDWEFPGARGSDSGDRILFTAMLKVGGRLRGGMRGGRVEGGIGGGGIGEKQ